MDRKSLPIHEKPPSYETAGPSTTPSTDNEVLLFAEAIIDSDKYMDEGTTPAIIFQNPSTASLSFYTYKKLTSTGHQFHDKYRCHLHLISLPLHPTTLNLAFLAGQVSRQVVSPESCQPSAANGKMGDKVGVEVKRITVVWKGEESGVRRYSLSENSVQQLCYTNLTGMGSAEVARVWRKMEMRGWVDRVMVVYGVCKE